MSAAPLPAAPFPAAQEIARAVAFLALSLGNVACHSNSTSGMGQAEPPAEAQAAPEIATAAPIAPSPAEPPAVAISLAQAQPVANESPRGSAGFHVLVLKDGRRIECLEAPVAGMGRVMFKSPDGVTHAISEQIVDMQATRLQAASAPASTASVSMPPSEGPSQPPTKVAATGGAKAAAPERPPVPDFEAVRPDGTKVRLSDLKGKVVLVDFWATWCGPCIREMPTVKAAYAKLAGPNFEILGVSLDHDREKMKSYVEQQGIAWPQYFDGQGWGNTVARAWGVNSIPTAVLLDKEGKVARVGLRGPELEFAVAELVGK